MQYKHEGRETEEHHLKRRLSRMRIGTVLFTWHRSWHTQKVLDALKHNTVLPDRLYIFQDGMSDKTNCEEWHKVNKMIQNVDFCDTTVIVSKVNIGCRKSIVSGINYVLSECDAAIVLEDDCVPESQFINFMTTALETYQNNDKVYSISGYAWDVLLQVQENDAYFNGRSCSYGWGTWQDKWMAYEENYNIVNEIKADPSTMERLRIWGNDLEEMLVGNIHGICDAWDVFWSLNIIKRGGYCLSPYKSLVRNIGFDGSGIHCGQSGYFQNLIQTQQAKNDNIFKFPSRIENTKECEEEFRFLYGGKKGEEKDKYYRQLLVRWIQMKQAGKKIKFSDVWNDRVAVWGKNDIFDLLIEESDVLREHVACIVESRPQNLKYNDIPIVTIDKLSLNIKNIIVIPFFDIDVIALRVHKIRPDIKLWGIDELIG